MSASSHFDYVFANAKPLMRSLIAFWFAIHEIESPPHYVENDRKKCVDISHANLIELLVENAPKFWAFINKFRRGLNEDAPPSFNKKKGKKCDAVEGKDVMQKIMGKYVTLMELNKKEKGGKNYHMKPFTKTLTFYLIEAASAYFYLICDKAMFNDLSSAKDKLEIFKSVASCLSSTICSGKIRLMALTAKLVEGHAARYVTGTGATDETRRRYDVIHNVTGRPKVSRSRASSQAPPNTAFMTPKPKSSSVIGFSENSAFSRRKTIVEPSNCEDWSQPKPTIIESEVSRKVSNFLRVSDVDYSIILDDFTHTSFTEALDESTRVFSQVKDKAVRESPTSITENLSHDNEATSNGSASMPVSFFDQVVKNNPPLHVFTNYRNREETPSPTHSTPSQGIKVFTPHVVHFSPRPLITVIYDSNSFFEISMSNLNINQDVNDSHFTDQCLDTENNWI